MYVSLDKAEGLNVEWPAHLSSILVCVLFKKKEFKKRQVDLGKLFDTSDSGLIFEGVLHDVPFCYNQCMQLGLKRCTETFRNYFIFG